MVFYYFAPSWSFVGKNGPRKQNSSAEPSSVCDQTRYASRMIRCASLTFFFFFFACIYNTYCTYVYTYILRAFFFTWNTSLTYRTGKQKQCPFWMKSMICAVLVDDKNEESNSRVICQTHSKNVKGQKLWHATMLYVSFFLFVLFFSFSLVKRYV